MKIITKAVFQMTPEGFTLLEQHSFEHAGAVALCKKDTKIPDPYETANTQTQKNQSTAAYNNAVNHGNTTTPLGSQTFTSRIDPVTGATVYDSNISLTPAQQQLLDQRNQQDLTLGNTANDVLGRVQSTYATPFDATSDLGDARQETQDALYQRQASYLDPQYEAAARALETKLANQGIGVGSEAFNNSMDDYNRGKTFDYDRARTSSITGASDEQAKNLQIALALRNQPLNEFNAIRDSTEVKIPTFTNPQSSQTNPVDISGLIQGAANTQNATNAANTQALTGIAGTLGSAAIDNGALSGLFGVGAQGAGAGAVGAGTTAATAGAGAAGLGSSLGAGTSAGGFGSGALGASGAGALDTSGLLAGVGSGGSTGAAAGAGATAGTGAGAGSSGIGLTTGGATGLGAAGIAGVVGATYLAASYIADTIGGPTPWKEWMSRNNLQDTPENRSRFTMEAYGIPDFQAVYASIGRPHGQGSAGGQKNPNVENFLRNRSPGQKWEDFYGKPYPNT